MTAALERIPGIVLGAAVGDALGYPIEFTNLREIKRRYGPNGVRGYVEHQEQRGGRKVALFSDDTQLAMVVLEGLLECRQRQAELDETMQTLARGFMRWSVRPRGGHRNPGGACLAGCQALLEGSHWSTAGGENAGGCGSVMRAYPLALVFADDPDKAQDWAVEQSKLTHRAPLALAACAALVRGLLVLLGDGSIAEFVETMVGVAADYDGDCARRIRDAFESALLGEEPEQVLRRYPGWAAHDAIAAATFVFLRRPDEPREALLEAVNISGDSDSVGTLVGAFVGARHGLGGIPAEWVEEVEGREELFELAQRTESLARRARGEPLSGVEPPGRR